MLRNSLTKLIMVVLLTAIAIAIGRPRVLVPVDVDPIEPKEYTFRPLQLMPGNSSIGVTCLSNSGFIGGHVFNQDPETGIYTSSKRATLWDSSGVIRSVTPPSSNLNYDVRAVNNRGDLAGDFSSPQGGSSAFMWNGNQIRVLQDLSDTSFTLAFGINDEGVIVGYREGDGESIPNRAFIFDEDSGMTEIFGQTGRDINNRGEVIVTENSEAESFLLPPSQEQAPIPLVDPVGRHLIRAEDLNENGDVLYWARSMYEVPDEEYVVPDQEYVHLAVIRHAKGNLEILPQLEGRPTNQGYALNDHGAVVGGSCLAGYEGMDYCVPFLYSAGQIMAGREILLEAGLPEAFVETAKFIDINNWGDILVGYRQDGMLRAGLLRKTRASQLLR